MKNTRIRIALIAAALVVVLLFLQDGAVVSGDEVTLNGEFFWKHMKHTGDLDAVFTRTGGDRWDVEFRFSWEDDVYVYRGTAEGSLIDGELHGSVITTNPQRPQTFYFDGRSEDGRFNGTHTALQSSGGTHPTGTLTLSR